MSRHVDRGYWSKVFGWTSAIMFMNQYHPGLGVGVEPGGVPGIKYLHYEVEWDKEATPEDIKEYKQYTNQRLEDVKRHLDPFSSA